MRVFSLVADDQYTLRWKEKDKECRLEFGGVWLDSFDLTDDTGVPGEKNGAGGNVIWRFPTDVISAIVKLQSQRDSWEKY